MKIVKTRTFRFLTLNYKFLKMLKTFGSKLILTTASRGMSVFPPHYIEPIYSKSSQLELKKNNKIFKLMHLPTKPAQNDQSESVFHNELVIKMTNYITRKGNKILARELLEKSFECIKRTQIERYNLASISEKSTICCVPEEILIKAIENSRPLLQLTSVKRGGVRYQVPVPVNNTRSYFLAMKWLLEAGKEKESKVNFPEKFAWEILDASHGQGRVVKRKHDLHRLCEANRAYAHYRWS